VNIEAVCLSAGLEVHESPLGEVVGPCPLCHQGSAEFQAVGDGRVVIYCGNPDCRAAGAGAFYDSAADFIRAFGGSGEDPAKCYADVPELQSWSLPDFLARDDLPTPAEVVQGLLLEGTVSFWFGPAGSGKSASAADMARCKAAGWSFMGRFPCERGPAVLIEQESAPALLRQRLADLEAGEPLPEGAATLTILPLQGLRLDDETSRTALRELLRGLKPKLIVCDTLAALAGGTDLLDVRQVRPLMEWFRQIATEFAAAVLLLAHTPKWSSKEPTLAALYGSEDLGAACDSAFALCRLPTAVPTFRVAQVKNRWGADLADFTFALEVGPEGGIVLTGGDPEKEGVEAILLDALDSGDVVPVRELTDIVEAAGYTADAARKALQRLRARGKVTAEGATNKRGYQRAEEALPQ
jgi:hypothetical protein